MKTEGLDAVAETEQPVDLTALLEQSDAPQSESVGGNHRNTIELGRKMASQRAFSRVPKLGGVNFKDESSHYDPNQAFNATRRNSESTEMARCPGVTFYNTSDQRGSDKCSTQVGASGYAQEHLQFVQDPESLAIVSHSGYWQLFWEAKRIDFVGDNGILFEHITDERTKKHAIADFGLTSSYAAQMCANQYRDFAFSISLTDETARLLRWDRSGVIFSEDIHYRNNPKPRCWFLWRFGNADSSQRGANTSVHKRITEAEESLFRDTVKAHIKLQLGLTDKNGIRHLCWTILRIVPSALEHLLRDGTQADPSLGEGEVGWLALPLIRLEGNWWESARPGARKLPLLYCWSRKMRKTDAKQ
ncbi:hypothetical protein EDD18DRAFT_1340292 [Armillaria luteobubalina]|uniref:Fungal-type protein kinase domain-containing protein n=1 Tax=Armillaria luteobubalina TaxID=153913 RepID=A0AA39NWS3_9AGAR|nr:hypothetical protein EDD18DRAFT_1340292 [Armillaria luteobubalina]